MRVFYACLALVGFALMNAPSLGEQTDESDRLEAAVLAYLDAVEADGEAGEAFGAHACAYWSDRLQSLATQDASSPWAYTAWAAIGALDSQRGAWASATQAWRHARETAPSWDFSFRHLSDEYASLREQLRSERDPQLAAQIRAEMRSVVAEAEAIAANPDRRPVIGTTRDLALRLLWLLQQEYDDLLASGDAVAAALVAEKTGEIAQAVRDDIRSTLSGWSPDDCYARAAVAYASVGDGEGALRSLNNVSAVDNPRQPASFHALYVFLAFQDVDRQRAFFENWAEEHEIDANSPELALRYARSIASVEYTQRGEYAQSLVTYAERLVNQHPEIVVAADQKYVAEKTAAGVALRGWEHSYYSATLLELLAHACHVAGDSDGAAIAASELLSRFPGHPGCAWAEGLLESTPH